MSNYPLHDPLIIAGRKIRSRLWVGTGKYKNFEETRLAIEGVWSDIMILGGRSAR